MPALALIRLCLLGVFTGKSSVPQKRGGDITIDNRVNVTYKTHVTRLLGFTLLSMII